MMEALKAKQAELRALVEQRDAAIDAFDAAALDTEKTDDQREELLAAAEGLNKSVEEKSAEVDRLTAVSEARANSPVIVVPSTSSNTATGSVTIHARANGTTKEEPTYRPDRMQETSFFRDVLASKSGDAAARDRLNRNREEALDTYKQTSGVDYRDMQNLTTQGGEFVPTVYLNDLWVSPSIAKRPFADKLPKYPLPATGTTLSLPHLSSGVSVAGRADAAAVSETDGVTASITHDVNEIAGQVDIGRIAVNRSEPGLDKVIGETLLRRYNAYLDTQCLSGTGTAPQHRGIRAVSGVNTTVYTDASPTMAELYPKIYEAISEIDTARAGEARADLLVVHGRRAAWMASQLSSTFPLLSQSGMVQTTGTQDGGFTQMFAGLEVISDNNVGTTLGAGTEDEIYIVASQDLYLAEGPLFSRVFEDVGSGSGLIRYQIYAYSSFLSKRYPGSISVVSGTGLIAPSF